MKPIFHTARTPDKRVCVLSAVPFGGKLCATVGHLTRKCSGPYIMHSEVRMELVGLVSMVQFWRLQQKIRHFQKQLSLNVDSSSVDLFLLQQAGGAEQSQHSSLKVSPIPELVGNS